MQVRVKPAPKPAPVVRAVLYLRQSTYREESISLELQETAGRDYANRMGYTVVAVEADPGISGRTWNRPAVQRVMQMVEAREVDVIVLWKWSRLSRSRLDWAVAVDKVESIGGRIESATEPLDTTTSTGRFARGMLTEFAAFESERIGDTWKEAQARRAAHGLPHGGHKRFGYDYTKGEGYTPNPVEAPLLGEMYRRYIGGESIYSLVLYLNQRGIRTTRGAKWNDINLRRLLDTGFAAGLFTYNGEKRDGAQEPIISREEWDAYQAARQRRRPSRRGERSPHLYSGLVWCWCGAKMHVCGSSNGRVSYRCDAAYNQRAHDAGYVSDTRLHEAVNAWLDAQRSWVDPGLEKKLGERKPPKQVDRVAKLNRELIKLDARMDTLTDKLVDAGIPQSAYERARDRILSDRQEVEAELVQARAEEQRAPVRIMPALLETWGTLPTHRKREMLKAVIARIVVQQSPGPHYPKTVVIEERD